MWKDSMRTKENSVHVCLNAAEMKAYLSHELSESEEQLIDLHLKDCELCCEALQAIEEHEEMLPENEFKLNDIEQEFKKVVKNNEHLSASNNKWITTALKYAAVALLAITSVFLIEQWSTEKDHQAIAVHYFQPYEDILTSRSDEPNTEEMVNGMSFYNQGKYREAEQNFGIILNRTPDNHIIMFYSGIANFAIDRNQLAKERFEQVMENSKTLEGVAAWYLSLTYLKMKDVEKAKVLLEQIVDKQSTYASKAAAVLEQIQ